MRELAFFLPHEPGCGRFLRFAMPLLRNASLNANVYRNLGRVSSYSYVDRVVLTPGHPLEKHGQRVSLRLKPLTHRWRYIR
jgi:hypothetical protein